MISLPMLLLVAGALALPLAGSLVVVIVSRLSPARRSAPITGVVITGIAALCATGLLWMGHAEVPLPVWIPDAGPMSLHIGGLGTQAAALTAAMLFISMLLSMLLTADRETPGTVALLLAGLAVANASFLAGHFLFRYLALEMVGLCIGLAPLLSSRGNGLQQAKGTYLLLRLGDVGLLGAILVLWHASGTLDIGPAIDAGTRLPPSTAAWTVGGLLLAVWVKAGLWPFHTWQATAHDLPPVTGAWLYGLVMPNLGLYLLYRTMPLLATAPWLRWGAVVAAVLGVAAIVIRELAQSRELPSSASLGSVLSAVGVLIAVFGRSGHVAVFLLIATPFRIVLWLAQGLWADQRLAAQPTEASGVGTPSRRSGEGWIIAIARSISRRVEVPIAREGVTRLWTLLLAFARWLNVQVEQRIAQEGVNRLWRFLAGTAQAWHRAGEQRAVTDIVRGTARGARSVSQWLRTLHTGNLRVNLRWAVVAMGLVVSLLVVIGW